ncbi:MAG TPA: NRDE family protein [Minicystis sp.]|nr:NRDE family protein [Minicystis sp.]
MCLVAFAHDVGPYELVLAANRDERYDRPTAPADAWPDAPSVLGGRDLEKGGTWLAIATSGRLAAVTNVRRGAPVAGPRSRGELCAAFVRGADEAPAFAERAFAERASYGSFNLVVRAGGRMAYASSVASVGVADVARGVYGLSNASMDVAWPKVVLAKRVLAEALELPTDAMTEELFAMLADRSLPDDERLPSTGVPRDVERALAPVFVVTPAYGTRSSTVVVWRRGGDVAFEERRFGAGGRLEGVTRRTTRVDAR